MSDVDVHGDAHDEQYEEAERLAEMAGGEMTGPMVSNDDAANRMLRGVGYYRRRIEEAEKAFAQEIGRLEMRRDLIVGQLEKRAAWFETPLLAQAQAGQTSLKWVCGSVKRTKGRERVEVQDQETFERWAKETAPGLVVVTISRRVDKKGVLAYVKTDGEEPPGVDVVTGDDTYKVVVS